MQRFILQKGERSLTKLVAFLSALSQARAWKVEVSEYRRTRSDAQNNALWGVAYKAIREASGNDPDEMHEYFCIKYFGSVEKNVFGLRKQRPRRTTTTNEAGERSVLSTTEFMDFYSFIQQHMAEFGIYVPDPNEDVNDVA